MLHMAMTDVDVGTGHARPAQRSPDTKAAVEYLIAFGATAITIVEIDGVCAFHTGHKIDPRAVSVQWLPETHARAVVRQARRDAGRNPDAATAARALAQAAADHRQTLTPDDVAISRARDAANRITTLNDARKRSQQPRAAARPCVYARARPISSRAR
jgi:hypothetical protein